jgi:predicted DNA-binding transcriptional regulator AlpA
MTASSTPNFGEAETHRLRSRADAAEFLGVAVSTLERWDREGFGPRPVKIGPRRVGYRTGDLVAFIETRATAAA